MFCGLNSMFPVGPTALAGLALSENQHALPRAFFVPRVQVVPDLAAILQLLADPRHDPRRTVLIETPPADGFTVADGNATETATIVADRSEEVVFCVEAYHPGFVFVSDQDYLRWEATVNGVPTPILRANYVFRIRAPAGRSIVTFRDRPASVRIGLWLSAAALALVLFAGRRRWRAAA